MKILKYFRFFSLTSILFASCVKTDYEVPSPTIDFKGSFIGIMETQGIDNNLEGIVIINGQDILIDVMTGSLEGSITDEGGFYHVTINESKGIFAGSAGLSGSLGIEQSEFDFVINGDYVTGSIMTIHGQGDRMEDRDQLWRNARSKSAVYFSHSESCEATITLNNTTLGHLNGYSVESEDGKETRCDALYKEWDAIHRNVDDFQSRLFCNTGMLKNLSGNYFLYTACNTAGFVLPKNQKFTYTVQWDNGNVTTGEFTSPDGGLSLPICLTNDTCSDLGSGNTGGGTGAQTGQFTFNGTTYDGISWPNAMSNCSGSEISVQIETPDQLNEIVIWKMPQVGSGTYSLNNSDLSCSLFLSMNINGRRYQSINGTLTKSDLKSFTFSSEVRPVPSGSERFTVTGSGTY